MFNFDPPKTGNIAIEALLLWQLFVYVVLVTGLSALIWLGWNEFGVPLYGFEPVRLLDVWELTLFLSVVAGFVSLVAGLIRIRFLNETEGGYSHDSR